MLRIQRNKYITFMLIYVSIALNVFVLLLRHMYKKRHELESLGLLERPVSQGSDKADPHTISEIRETQKSK